MYFIINENKIQPNGLMSNQIFNNKFQQNILTDPHSSRNFESKDLSNFFASSDSQLVEKNNKWFHKYPSYIIQKTENVEKSEYPTLYYKNYSQIGKNQNQVSFKDQQIKQEFQALINAKQHQQKSFSMINQRMGQKQQQSIQNKTEDLQIQQKVRRPSSPQFKFVYKQKQTKTSGQHIKLTFEKGQKIFDTSFQNKETSKSVVQLKINDHFIKLQNEYERELYSKPFENTKYSEISKQLNCQTQESPIAVLYKKKNKQIKIKYILKLY
ncbi:unnamed protein product [Paramecium sonneborni]|uniref:Uncharacterized protein n=1 Tax=Paramecium sonneborni TaxID=65129 RepID=A0A8S1R2I1_9CILI|nr:unnamed protein product [Paramecium sonneborni]